MKTAERKSFLRLLSLLQIACSWWKDCSVIIRECFRWKHPLMMFFPLIRLSPSKQCANIKFYVLLEKSASDFSNVNWSIQGNDKTASFTVGKMFSRSSHNQTIQKLEKTVSTMTPVASTNVVWAIPSKAT